MPTNSATAAGGNFVALPSLVRNFYSKEVFWKAQPRLRFLQFTKVRRDLQAVRGKAIVFVKYDNLLGGGPIAESDVIVPQSMSASEVIIAVVEQANATQVTEFLLKTSLLNTLEDASRQLANNFAITLDGQLRDAALSTTNVFFGNNEASAAAMDASAFLTPVDVRNAVELLATNNAPKINGDFYVCFAHPHQIRHLRESTEWLQTHQYFGRRNLYLGEAGMYEGVVFIETTQMPKYTTVQATALYGAGLTQPAYYACVFFGENTLAWGIALDVELRDDGVIDLGRKHTLGWYGIWGTGLLETAYAVRILTV